MKKLLSIFLVICLLISLCACRKKNPKPSDTPNSTTTSNTESTRGDTLTEDTTLIAVSVPPVTENLTHDDGTILFQYTYQNMSLVLNKPEVADKIIVDFLNRVDSTRSIAESTASMAKAAYSGDKNWSPYLYHITYSPARIDPEVLSLYGNNVVFSGAGHPEITCVSASYDLATGDVLTLASIMQKDASTDMFRDLVLDSLAEIADSNYLYDNYKETVTTRFTADPSQDEAWYFTQSGLCFYFAPYEIAPYSSRVVTVEIPYEKLRNLIHIDYLPDERPSATGKHTVSPFENINLDSFDHIAEIVANKEGKMYMVQADNMIQDVRILFSDTASSYTVFAAYNLSPGNGIMVQADEAMLNNMKLAYKTGKEIITTPLLG